MNAAREVVVLSAVRTAVGDFGGALKDVPITDLATTVVREAMTRSGMDGTQVGQCVFGSVIGADGPSMYLARVAALGAGLPVETPAMQVSRRCGSGLQAIVSAAQAIALGDIDAAVAGGAETMSRAPYILPTLRWGQRMNDGAVIDAMVSALHDPIHGCHMGVTAENLAEKYQIGRDEQDELAVQSHQRAARAASEGRFREQLVPVEIRTRKGTIVFDVDEHVRPDATVSDLGRLKPVFKKDGTVAAGNASGINDAAAAVTLMERGSAERLGLVPLARLVGYAHAGVDPLYMGIGPVPAVRKLFARTGLGVGDMDVIELNEAFAAQALACIRELGLPMERTNPNGSGISIGHPVGATGCIVSVKAIHELHRIGGRYALVTMCIGAGEGIAAIYERL